MGSLATSGGSNASLTRLLTELRAEARRSGLNPQQIQRRFDDFMAAPDAADDPTDADDAVEPAPPETDGLGSWERLGSTKVIQFIKSAPLIEQGPFRPEDLASVRFKAGTKTVYALNAPCQSGKSPSMVHLALKAVDEGCWCLVILNINNNRAISSLVDKFTEIHDKLGTPVGGRAAIFETDDIFHTRSAGRLKRHCKRLEDPANHSLWIVKADVDAFSKLMDHVPPAAWARCVVFIDEVHCFFSLEAECKKKAEVQLCRILFGDNHMNDRDGLASLRTRSVVLSDATDGDVPHVFKHFNFQKEDFKRICADPARLAAGGYVSTLDFELFKAEGRPTMAQSFNRFQRYGKDADELLAFRPPPSDSSESDSVSSGELQAEQPRRVGVTGREFALQVTREHFDPNLLAFLKDALEHPVNTATFVLELTTSNVSEETFNSVEHHAQSIARLFPDVLALAEHGEGCYHMHSDGSRTFYPSHRVAYDKLQKLPDDPSQPKPKYHNKPKYLITNLGYGSIQYSFPAAPVTHIYIGFAAGVSILLVKAQGLGRACGYVRADLDKCGVSKVRVLCTKKQLHDMTKGLATITEESFAQFPHHAAGTYTEDAFLTNQIGHRANRAVKATRVTATVQRGLSEQLGVFRSTFGRNTLTEGATGVGASRQGVDRISAAQTALHNSVEQVVDVQLGTTRALVSRDGSITNRESLDYQQAIRDKCPGVSITSKVVFITGNKQQHQDGLRCVTDLAVTPINTEFGRAARRLQTSILPFPLGTPAYMSLTRSDVNDSMYNGNPARLGKRSGLAAGQLSYRMVWGYDQKAKQILGIVRITPLAQISLPFIYHKMVMHPDGSLGVSAMLVTEQPASNEASTSGKRARTSYAKDDGSNRGK